MDNEQRAVQILVVEDDAGLRMVYRHVLTRMNIEVLEAETGDIALEMVEQCRPDIVFLDMHLPGVDGLVIFKRIRELPHLQETKIVVVTADKYVEEFAGVEDVTFLLKPVLPNQIRELVAELLA